MRVATYALLAGLMLICTSVAGAEDSELLQEVRALKQRVAELEAQQDQQQIQTRNAEMMREMLAEMAAEQDELAANTGMTAGYDRHFFIKSADDQFRLDVGAKMQMRHTYSRADEGDGSLNKDGTLAAGGDGVDGDATAFDLERTRLILSGHVFKDLKYFFQADFDDDGNDFGVLKDFYVKYSFMPELGVRAGRGKVAFGKQENVGFGQQMLVDRSLANEVFHLFRSTGLELFGELPVVDTALGYRFGVYNGFRDAQSRPFEDNDNNPALAARATLPLLGATESDFVNSSDLAYHENMVALVGCSFGYVSAGNEDHFAGGNDDNYKVLAPGGDGKTNIIELGGESILLGADISMKYMGLAVNLEGFYQHNNLADEFDYASDFGNGMGIGRDLAGVDGDNLDNFGWHAEAGYFIVPESFELVSRISGVHVDNSNDSYEYAGGWNWYLNGNDLKLSMDVSYIDDLPLRSTRANYDGVQNNSLFMIRSQLQLQF